MAAAFNLTAQINLQGPGNLKPIVSKIKKELGSIKTKLDLDVKPGTAKNIGQITRSLNTLSKAAVNANNSISSLNGSLSTLASSFNNASSSTSAALNGLGGVTKAAKSSSKAIHESRTAIEEFGKQSGLAIKRFAAFSTVSTVIYGVVNALTTGFKEFMTFNQEIVRLSQVTNKSVADLKGVSDEITRLSTGLGVASSDLLTVTTTLAQAGFTAEETKIALEALAKSALAPSFENLASTTEGAIAAMRQFGIQAGELDNALGSINAVAAAFAVEAGDIIAAIQRTGGVFASSSKGVSEGTDALNEFIAVFTSVRATTRESAETIATGLRTIFTRIQRSSTIQLLKDYGVELRDLEGKFVGPYEAVKRLSEGLSKIDPRSAAFAAISEELGGFRQIGKVIPLLQQFSVAQDALNVAQKGQKSLAKDAVTAQQSLAVQFNKTRESFLALIRDIGETGTFKAFVGTTLTLTNALITLGGALKPILPLLLTFTAIKLGSSLKQFSSGFLGVFGGGGGATGGGGGGGGPSGGGGGGTSGKAASLVLNTTALTTLNTSILALNQNIVNTNSLLMNRPTKGFASGGLVPGSGNSDTFRANLTPGEFVIRKKAVEKLGIENLAAMNRGGEVQRFVDGSTGQGVKRKRKVIDRTSAAYKKSVAKRIKEIGNIQEFGLVGLQSGLGGGTNIPQLFTENHITPKSKTPVKIKVGILSRQNAKQSSDVENILKRGYGAGVKRVAKNLASSIGANAVSDDTEINKIIDNAGFYNVIGAGLEAAIGMLDFSTYIKKPEKAKSIDFPKGIGKASSLFGDFPSNIPTDITRTVSGFGKGIGAYLAQIERYLEAKNKGILTNLTDTPTPVSELVNRLITASRNPSDRESINTLFRTYGIDAGKTPIPNLTIKNNTNKVESIAKALRDNQPLIDQLESRYPSPTPLPNRKASGGSISGEDTIPALLTPGEFVFNKKAAQRIGYSNLNRLNKADKISGFNKGGTVGFRRYNAAGAVTPMGSPGSLPIMNQPQQPQREPIDRAAVVAAITSILLPEVQKLAASFGKLEGSAAEAAAGLGGFIREASSMVLSAGIALQTVGASKGTIAGTQLVAGSLGGIGGALTDYSAKAMEIELGKNTELLGKFNKDLEEYRNAATEELKMKASKELEKTFFNLDKSIRQSIPGIDNLERLNNIGQTIGNLNSTIITTISALAALSIATQAQTAATATSAASTGVSGAVGAPVAAASLLSNLSPYIKVFVIAASAVSAFVQILPLFTGSLKKSNEQLEKLASALEETVKSSKDFSLTNDRYINTILPQFNAGIPRQQLGELEITNELNLLFREQFKSILASQGIILSQSESMVNLQEALVKRGDPETIKKFNEARDTTKEILTRDLFRKAKREQGLEEATINDLMSRMGLEEMARVATEYAGKFNQNKLAADQLALAMSKLRISVLSLNNVLSLTESGFQQIVANTTNTFDDLDRRVNAVLSKEPVVTTGATVRRDIQVLENLPMARPEQLDAIFQRASGTLGINPNDTEQVKLFTQLRDQTKGLSIIERDMGFALTAISRQNADENKTGMILEDVLGSSIREALGPEGDDIANQLMAETTNAINRVRQEKGGSVALEDLAPAIQEYINKTKSGLESFRKSLESVGKAFDLLGEQEKKLFEANQELLNLQIQRRYNEMQNNIEQKRALGQYVTLGEMNSGAMSEILKLTQSIQTPIGRLTGQSGTNNPDIIFNELQRTIAEQQRISDIPFTKRTKDEREMLVPLANKAASLRKALEKLADSSTFLKNMFDKLAQSEGLDKNKRNMLFDLITGAGDPSKMLQFQKSAMGLDVLLAGAQGKRKIGVGEAPMAIEGLQLANQLFPPEIADKIQRDFLINFVKNNKQIGTPESRKKILELLEKGSPLTQTLNARIDAEKAAIARTNQFLEQSYVDAIRDRAKTLANSMEYVSIMIQSLFGNTTTYGKAIDQKIGAYNPPKPSPPVTVPEDRVEALRTSLRGLTVGQGMFTSKSLESGQVEDIINRLLPVSTEGVTVDQFNKAITEAAQMAANNYQRDYAVETRSTDTKPYGWRGLWGKAYLEQLGKTFSRTTQPRSVQTTQQALLPFVNDPTMGPLIRQQEAQTAADQERRVRYDEDFRNRRGAPINKNFPVPSSLPNGQPGLVPNVTRPAVAPRFGGAASTPLSMDSSAFDNSVNKMANLFNDPNSGIGKLSTSIESLGKVTNSFALAIEELKKTIPEGIVKVEQKIQSQVDVSIPQGVDINASSMQLAQSDINNLGKNLLDGVKTAIGSMFFGASGG